MTTQVDDAPSKPVADALHYATPSSARPKAPLLPLLRMPATWGVIVLFLGFVVALALPSL